jgi:hypothetical protein
MLSPRTQRVAIATCTVALAFPALADKATINTYAGWDKVTTVSSFGCPDTTTYGQVITVPDGLNHLDKFVFWLRNASSSGGSMVARAYVYRWDNANMTVQSAAQFESPARIISYSDALFHAEAFNPRIAVKPGVQYVMFLSIDREYVDCTNSYGLGWGFVQSDAYPGGEFVFQNNAGDDLQWRKAWLGFDDLAFKAYLSP